jgi:hypothetical protein
LYRRPTNEKRPAIHAGLQAVNKVFSRVSGAGRYGLVTTQYPGVISVAGEMGCVRFPLESTARAPIWVMLVVPLKTLL